MSARTRTPAVIGLALFAVIATCLVVSFAGKEPSPTKPDRSERAEKPVVEDTPSPVGAVNRSPSIVSSNADTGDATLRLPNIGSVEVKGSNEEAVLFQAQNGRLPFRVYRTPNGQFVRAEYFKPGSTVYEESAEKLERVLLTRDERLTRIPPQPPPIAWTAALAAVRKHLGPELEKTIGLVITYVEYQFWDEPPAPVFLFHLYGVMRASDKMPDEETYRRIRFVIDSKGEITRFDNTM